MSCVRGPRPPVNCRESATLNEVGVGDGMAGRAEGRHEGRGEAGSAVDWVAEPPLVVLPPRPDLPSWVVLVASAVVSWPLPPQAARARARARELRSERVGIGRRYERGRGGSTSRARSSHGPDARGTLVLLVLLVLLVPGSDLTQPISSAEPSRAAHSSMTPGIAIAVRYNTPGRSRLKTKVRPVCERRL